MPADWGRAGRAGGRWIGRWCVRAGSTATPPVKSWQDHLCVSAFPLAPADFMFYIVALVHKPRYFMDDWLTRTEAAALCRVTTMTLYRWLADPGMGFPEPDGTGGRKRWRRDAVTAWLRVNRPWVLTQRGE